MLLLGHHNHEVHQNAMKIVRTILIVLFLLVSCSWDALLSEPRLMHPKTWGQTSFSGKVFCIVVAFQYTHTYQIFFLT